MEHNNIIYTKEEVIASIELKEILFKQLKKALLNEKCKEYSRRYRIENKDKVNEYHRLNNYNKYHNNPEWRATQLERNRICRYNKINMDIPTEPLKRGRRQKMGLNDNLELYNLF
jgi:hypothetical protein